MWCCRRGLHSDLSLVILLWVTNSPSCLVPAMNGEHLAVFMFVFRKVNIDVTRPIGQFAELNHEMISIGQLT